MFDYKEVLDVVYKTIEELNESLPDEKKLVKEENTALFGKSSKLDSLELVNLIVLLEQNVEDEFGKSVTLADEKALSREESPFKSVKMLAEYISQLLNE